MLDAPQPVSPLDHEVHHALRTNPYVSRSQLRFETKEGHVILRGKVQSFFQKQMAQESLRRVEGVRQIENQLTVAER